MRARRSMGVLILSSAVALILTEPVLAHTAGITEGLFSGFLHPMTGWDHILALVAAGLWAAFLGRPAMWILPIVFPPAMAFGGALGVLGVPLPQVDTVIALSTIVLGLVVALAVRPPLWIAVGIVVDFAIFHGHVHGTELSGATNPIAYSIGFVVATVLLQISGILFGLLTHWPFGQMIVRTGGAAIALSALAFLIGIG